MTNKLYKKKGEVLVMTEKKKYDTAEIELLLFRERDVISTSGEAALGTAGSDDGGWTTWSK